jgi:predicted DNA-binding transcriptional regulator AlpA
MPTIDTTLRPAEAAEYLKLSESTLAKLRCRGGGPEYLKLGKRVVYAKCDLDKWLAGCRRQCTAQ